MLSGRVPPLQQRSHPVSPSLSSAFSLPVIGVHKSNRWRQAWMGSGTRKIHLGILNAVHFGIFWHIRRSLLNDLSLFSFFSSPLRSLRFLRSCPRTQRKGEKKRKRKSRESVGRTDWSHPITTVDPHERQSVSKLGIRAILWCGRY